MDCNNDAEMEVPDGCEVDITSSDLHCGKCNYACPVGAHCQEGHCCYQDNENLKIDLSLFQCCAGNTLYEYRPHFAFPFCWGKARYACSKEDLSKNSCWERVQ